MHFALLPLLLIGTLPSPSEPGSHEAWLREVRAKEARGVRAAVEPFTAYVRANPADPVAAVERCKLIAALTEREEDEEFALPGVPTFAECLEKLKSFPDSELAVTYRIDHMWGADALTFADGALANPRIPWTNVGRARIHARLAQLQRLKRERQSASRNASRAMDLDPSLDLTSIVADDLLADGRKTEAMVVLSLRTQGSAYELQSKARQLIEAGSPGRAQWMLRLASAKPAFHPDPLLAARILEATGRMEEARQAYLSQPAPWNRIEVLSRLFRLQLETDDRDAAVRLYQALRAEGWKADPLARYRLGLLRKVPFAPWRARDLAGVGTLLGCVIGLAILPLLCFLPLHSWLLWRRLQQPRTEPRAAAMPEWWFRHLYAACALMLVTQFFAFYLFAYEDLLLWFAPQKTPSNASLAAAGLWHSFVLPFALAPLIAYRPQHLRVLGPGSWSLRKCLGQALVAIALTWVAGVLNAILMKTAAVTTGAFRLDALVQAMIRDHGLALTLVALAILVPICEELIFRSILLDVLSAHLRFSVANVLQALVFALAHVDLPHFLYYLVMAMLAGRMRRASGGLLSGILFHGGINALAVLMAAAAIGSPQPASRAVAAELDARVATCAGGAAGSVPEKLSGLGMSLNNHAWVVATDPDATPTCLENGLEAIGAALKQSPENAAWLDTKATLLFRDGRVDEAIDLERAAADLTSDAFHFSQVARFLRVRQQGNGPLVLGDATPTPLVSLTPRDGELVVEIEPAFPNGAVLYARGGAAGGLLQLVVGPGHDRSHRLPFRTAASEPRLDIALIDARGCDRCRSGELRLRYEAHDPQVDKLP